MVGSQRSVFVRKAEEFKWIHKNLRVCTSSENLCKHRQNFVISFNSPVLLSVLYEVQHLFSTFGVARNDLLREDI